MWRGRALLLRRSACARLCSGAGAAGGVPIASAPPRSAAAVAAQEGPAGSWASRPFWNLALLAPCAAAASLGAWQLKRYEWKVGELAAREAALSAAPVPAALHARGAAEWTRVSVEGETTVDAAGAFIGPRVRQEQGVAVSGFLHVVPVAARPPAAAAGRRWRWGGAPPDAEPSAGDTVLVNRGWVPASAKQQASEAAYCVKAEGVVRNSETPSSFVPDNVPEKGDWYWVDVPALARSFGLPEDTPLVQLVAHEGATAGAGPPTYPVPPEVASLRTFSVMPQDHLNYAATWFTLSVATLVIATRALRAGRKPPRAPPSTSAA